jgi:hypothetical protein
LARRLAVAVSALDEHARISRIRRVLSVLSERSIGPQSVKSLTVVVNVFDGDDNFKDVTKVRGLAEMCDRRCRRRGHPGGISSMSEYS